MSKHQIFSENVQTCFSEQAERRVDGSKKPLKLGQFVFWTLAPPPKHPEKTKHCVLLPVSPPVSSNMDDETLNVSLTRSEGGKPGAAVTLNDRNEAEKRKLINVCLERNDQLIESSSCDSLLMSGGFRRPQTGTGSRSESRNDVTRL